MTQAELTILNLGETLDQLCNLDPRGYGICRILYAAARNRAGEPLSTCAAKQLIHTVKPGDLVFILTGFVLPPFQKAETDGTIGAALLAHALVKALDAKPVILCPTEACGAIHALASCVGLHAHSSISDLRQYPISMAILPFSTDEAAAQAQTNAMLSAGLPACVISIEAPGANNVGQYHNAVGQNVTALEAKLDVLFDTVRLRGVPTIAIGDLGNEIGMGAIQQQLADYIPYAHTGGCPCGCGGGIAAATAAEHLITATVSDWGCYALIAALAFLCDNLDILHDEEMQQHCMRTASRHGLIDMSGWLTPAIDGTGLPMNRAIVALMRACVSSTMRLQEPCRPWFDAVIQKGFFAAKC